VRFFFSFVVVSYYEGGLREGKDKESRGKRVFKNYHPTPSRR